MTGSVLLVADLVESVRLLQQSAPGVIARWEQLVALVRAQSLPQHNGRLVKSLGDGLMLSFPEPRQALACAEQIFELLRTLNSGVSPDQHLQLRFGLHQTDWLKGEIDIYGHGVNLCVRLAALAQPQSLVMDNGLLQAFGLSLPDRWHASDLGRCYLKHLAEPVHCWQLRLLREAVVIGGASMDALRPRLAVLPVHESQGDRLPPGAADVLRDDLVRALAAHPHWQVVSRLSTQALQQRADLHRGEQGLLWVQLHLAGDTVGAELDARLLDGNQELWSGHYELPWSRLLATDAALSARIAAAMDQALLRQGTLALHEAALPNIPSYSLLLRAVQALHRLRPEAMAEAQTMLEHLAERHPRAGDVQAWLAKCHFVDLQQLHAANPSASADRLQQAMSRAIDLDPKQGVALALRGQALAFFESKLEAAHIALSDAVQQAPNEPLGWTYLCNAQAMLGDPRALQSHARAEALSPLDPMGFELDLMGSIAHSAVGSAVESLRLAQRSVQRGPLHLSSLVQLIVALVLNDRLEEAQVAARQYLQLRPQASVQRFIDFHIAGQRPIVRQQADALLAAGLPL